MLGQAEDETWLVGIEEVDASTGRFQRVEEARIETNLRHLRKLCVSNQWVTRG